MGANLTLLDPATLALLTNRDVIAIDQQATGSREALHSGDTIAWTADLPSGFPGGFTAALALFNTGDTAVTVNSSFDKYGLGSGTYMAKDAWAGKSLGNVNSVNNLTVEPHGSVLWLLRR